MIITVIIKQQVEGLLVLVPEVITLSKDRLLGSHGVGGYLCLLQSTEEVHRVYLAYFGIPATMVVEAHEKVGDKYGMVDFIFDFIDYFLGFFAIVLQLHPRLKYLLIYSE